MRAAAVLCAILSSSAAAAAAPDTRYAPISADTFEQILPGATIKGEYRFMRARTETFSFSEQHFENGTTLYREGHLQTVGQWYTLAGPAADKICYKYSSVELSGTHCFFVYEREGCYFGYGWRLMDSMKGIPLNYNDWEARWIIEGDGETCAEPVS